MQTSSAIDRVLAALRERGEVTQRGTGWKALCPAHGDNTPSLDIDPGRDGNVLLKCRSRGCSAAAVAQALGLTLRDLFNGTQPEKLSWDDRIERAYDYRDER